MSEIIDPRQSKRGFDMDAYNRGKIDLDPTKISAHIGSSTASREVSVIEVPVETNPPEGELEPRVEKVL